MKTVILTALSFIFVVCMIVLRVKYWGGRSTHSDLVLELLENCCSDNKAHSARRGQRGEPCQNR